MRVVEVLALGTGRGMEKRALLEVHAKKATPMRELASNAIELPASSYIVAIRGWGKLFQEVNELLSRPLSSFLPTGAAPRATCLWRHQRLNCTDQCHECTGNDLCQAYPDCRYQWAARMKRSRCSTPSSENTRIKSGVSSAASSAWPA
jgi:hypothetical protein